MGTSGPNRAAGKNAARAGRHGGGFGVAEPPAVPASPRSVTHTPAARFGPEVPIMVLIREWVAQGPISSDLSTYPLREAAA